MEKKAIGPVKRAFAPWEDPRSPAFIEFRNVTKRFGTFTAVDDLSLTIYEREFFALLGPSGCGKTTLMRMLAGFEEPNAGAIHLDGEPVLGIPPYRRPVNMMFQAYALFPHMTVEANVAFGLRQDRLPKDDIADRVAEMLKLVKLEPFARRKPHQLSGGQRQRVALARSLAKRPKVLLLDEPLAALDRKLREETQFELMDLQQELGLTFLIVTHDQEEAMTVADRIAVMDHGRLIQVATPAEIYEQPSTRYVAGFIGDINIIETRIEKAGEGGTTLRSVPSGIAIETDWEGPAAPGAEVAFAIRPEKVRISLAPPDDTACNAIEGEVWDIAYLGDFSLYVVRIADGPAVRASVANTTRIVERPITWDDKVWLSWSKDAGVVLER